MQVCKKFQLTLKVVKLIPIGSVSLSFFYLFLSHTNRPSVVTCRWYVG